MRQSVQQVAQPLIDRLGEQLSEASALIFVAIDGRSGSGKSTIAAEIANCSWSRAELTTVTVIEGDDFYAGGSPKTWEQRSVAEQVNSAFDWRRQHDVLRRLRLGEEVTFRPFDWASLAWDEDGVPLSADAVVAAPAPLVILEGVYSARPELQDLFDLRVLIETDPDVRRQQLLQREGEGFKTDWEERWSVAEDHYFTQDVPSHRFDLVLTP